MSGGGGQGNTNTIQNTAPWGGVQPYFTGSFPGSIDPNTGATIPGSGVPGGGVFPNAANLYATGGPKYFPGTTYSPETPAQMASVTGMERLGLGGSPITGASTNAALGLLSPGFLASNPGNAAYKDILSGGAGMKEAIARATPGLLDTFTQGNRLNSPGAAYAVSKGIGDAAAAAELSAASGLSSNYSTAAGQQNTANLVAPSTQGLGYTDLSNAFSAGGAEQEFGQNTINDAIARYNYQQTLPYNNLDWFNSVLTGNNFGTSTLTSPYFKPRTGGATGALGGAAGGAALGSYFGPYGTAIGAVAGGLLGGFS